LSGLPDGELETAHQMGLALHAGDVTSIELVDRAVRRAETWQPFTNAFSQLWAEEALGEARRIDRLLSTASHNPLDRGLTEFTGVPIAVKDLFDVAGHETTACSAALAGMVARDDAPIIERIRRSGLVMIGKTNQHELAAGGTNLVSACGRTGNPWDPRTITGGSSGGSAAAVAAGIVPVALGSDTGGSIRIPSSLCGTFGLKPTTGRLPIDGLRPLAPSMDCPGPIAGTVEDLEPLFNMMAGEPIGSDPLRPRTAPVRVRTLDGFFEEYVHDEVAATVEETARALSDGGIAMGRLDGRGIEDARHVWSAICFAEFAQAYAHLRDRRRLIAPSVVEWMELGERLTREELADAQRRRRDIARWYQDRLKAADALLIPTAPYPAPRADQMEVDLGRAGVVEVARVGPGFMTCSANLAGLPALSIPAGTSREGLPMGVSLVGRPGEEPVLLGIASIWVSATAHQPRRPALPG